MPTVEELEQKLNSLIEAKKQMQQKRVSYGESALRSGVQSATFGLADEAEAGIRALLDPEKEYADYIPVIREEYETAAAANPITSAVGGVAGGLATGFGTAGLVAKAAKGAGALGSAARFAQGTKTGAGIVGASEGALAGYGLSEDGSVGDVVTGGLVGGALGVAGKALANKMARGKPSSTEILIDSGDVPENAPELMAKNAKEAIGGFEPRKDSAQIAKSWKSITGDEAPPMALTRNQDVKKGWGELLESTTLAGKKERNIVEKAYRGVEAVADSIDEAGGRVTAEETGRRLRSGLQAIVDAKIKPLEASYNELEGVFDGIPVSKPAIKSYLTRLMKDPKATDPKVRQMIGAVGSELERIKDVSGLRQFRTTFRGQHNWQTMTDNERYIAKRIYQTLSNVRNNSISRQAAALKGTEFEKFVTPAHLKQLIKTDLEYGRAIGEISDLLQIDPARGISAKRIVGEYLSEKTPLETYYNDLFEKGDMARMRRLQAQNPEIFSVMRQRYLAKATEDATQATTGRVTPTRIIGKVAEKRPEVRDLMLGELSPKVSQAQDVMSALPGPFNTSNTAVKSVEYGNILTPNVLKWGGELARQGQASAKAALLRGQAPGAVAKIITAASDPSSVIKRISIRPNGQKYARILQRALDRGEASYATTFFLLSNSDPNFRSATQEGN